MILLSVRVRPGPAATIVKELRLDELGAFPIRAVLFDGDRLVVERRGDYLYVKTEEKEEGSP